MIEILELIWENLIDIVVGIFLIKNTTKRKARKEAEFEERKNEEGIELKRKRLQRLRDEDKEMTSKIKSNLAEEIKLEKELGENVTSN